MAPLAGKKGPRSGSGDKRCHPRKNRQTVPPTHKRWTNRATHAQTVGGTVWLGRKSCHPRFFGPFWGAVAKLGVNLGKNWLDLGAEMAVRPKNAQTSGAVLLGSTKKLASWQTLRQGDERCPAEHRD